MVEGILQEMMTLADEKVEKLNVILSIKPRQKQAIEEVNIEGINAALKQIQKQINEIDKINSAYSLKFKELKSELDIDSLEQIGNAMHLRTDKLEEKLDEIKSILEAIKVIDDENNLLIMEKFKETKGKLKNLRQGQIMNKSYNVASYGTMFIDQKK